MYEFKPDFHLNNFRVFCGLHCRVRQHTEWPKKNNLYRAVREVYFMSLNPDQEFVLNMWENRNNCRRGHMFVFLRISTLFNEIVPLVTRKE